MDLEGHYPISKDKKNRKAGRVSTENPGPARVGVFGDYALPIEEQWYYHAVSQIILAHSLIRSFPEVNPDKTGITGVSWGGNLTSTTMGVDNRFKFAIPAYGCGFLVGSSGHQGRAIKKGSHWDVVAKYYDGSAYFKNVSYPTLWVNGTNDYHFDMPATQKSSQAVNGNSTLRYQLRMGHGHQAVWNTKECYAFADNVVNGKHDLFTISKPKINNNAVFITSSKKAEKVELVYTTDSNPTWPDKEWNSNSIKSSGKKIEAEIPEGAVAVFFNLTDENGMMLSSEFIEVP